MAGRILALCVLFGTLAVACGGATPAGSSGGAPSGASAAPGATTASSPGATFALPPPQAGEVTMYGTFFAGDSLDVLYNVELESTSYVSLAIRSGTGAIGLLDQFTDPSFSDTFYGTYTTAGRLFGTTFGGDGGSELKSMAERDPVTFAATGLSICCSRFKGEAYALVGDALYGVALLDGQPTLMLNEGDTSVPIVAFERWPTGLFAVDRHLFAVSSSPDDLGGEEVSVAEIDPEAATIDLTNVYEVTDDGTFPTWRVAFDDRERVAYLARASASAIEVYRFRPGADQDMELVIEEAVTGVELINGLDADMGQVLVQWRLKSDGQGPNTYLLIDAAAGTSTEVNVPIDADSIGTQILTH